MIFGGGAAGAGGAGRWIPGPGVWSSVRTEVERTGLLHGGTEMYEAGPAFCCLPPRPAPFRKAQAPNNTCQPRLLLCRRSPQHACCCAHTPSMPPICLRP